MFPWVTLSYVIMGLILFGIPYGIYRAIKGLMTHYFELKAKYDRNRDARQDWEP